MKYCLLWNISEYHDNGGGKDYELFTDIKEMDERVNQLNNEWGDKLTISFSGEIFQEFTYYPKEKVTIYDRK